jgi:hypothetical protein
LAEQQRLVQESQEVQHQLRAEAQAARDVDWSSTMLAQTLAPVPTFSHVSAASDWLGDIDTAFDSGPMTNQIVVEATLWYGKVSPEVKADRAEFGQHLAGRAGAIAGLYGEQSEKAYTSFIEEASSLRERDVRTGSITEAASGLPQVGDEAYPEASFATGNYDNALPLEATTSERAPQLQELEANNGASASQDVTEPQNPPADQANGDAGTQENGSSMTNTQRSASRHEAYSGLPQVQQTVDPSDTSLQPTPLNQEVAFPWVLSPNSVNQTIQQTEQQLAERDSRKGAARRATALARQTYEAAMKSAGYDASGWMGDMGAGGYQDVPQGAPGSNLGQADPVYGQGGDQGDRQLRPYGEAEANDYTNDPGMDYQPGDDTHADLGQASVSPGMRTSSKHTEDPEIKQALKFIAMRKTWLDQQA